MVLDIFFIVFSKFKLYAVVSKTIRLNLFHKTRKARPSLQWHEALHVSQKKVCFIFARNA